VPRLFVIPACTPDFINSKDDQQFIAGMFNSS
jgi:hypothetical protein